MAICLTVPDRTCLCLESRKWWSQAKNIKGYFSCCTSSSMKKQNKVIAEQKEAENLEGSKQSLNKSSRFIVGIRWIKKRVLKMCFLQFNYFKFLWQYDEQNISVLMFRDIWSFVFRYFCARSLIVSLGLKGDLTLISSGIFLLLLILAQIKHFLLDRLHKKQKMTLSFISKQKCCFFHSTCSSLPLFFLQYLSNW